MTRIFRVLAVEDDEANIKLVRTILRDLPLDIAHAPTGRQAIDWLTAEAPDLILLDVNLPDMYGWEILDKFKDNGRLRNCPVIVLTAQRDPVHRLIGSLQAVAVYMHKPVNANELREQVRQLLDLDV